MALKINGKHLTPTDAAKRVVVNHLPNAAAADTYLDIGGRIGATELAKFKAALTKQIDRVRKMMGG